MPLDGLVFHFNVLRTLVGRRKTAQSPRCWSPLPGGQNRRRWHQRNPQRCLHWHSVKLETPFQAILATPESWLNMEACEMKCSKLCFNEHKFAHTNAPRIVNPQPSQPTWDATTTTYEIVSTAQQQTWDAETRAKSKKMQRTHTCKMNLDPINAFGPKLKQCGPLLACPRQTKYVFF